MDSKPLVILATIAGYFALLFIISALSSRKKDNETFYTGGRRIPWPIAAFAAAGAAISGVTFISVPGMVMTKGWSYLQMTLGFTVGYVIIAYALIPLFYRQKLTTIYGYLEQRFGAATHKTGAWFFFISKMLGASVRFFVVCEVLQSLVFGPLGIPFWANVIISIALIFLYTHQSGVKTVIWTDVLKSFCLIGSVVLCICFVVSGLSRHFPDAGSTFAAVFEGPSSRIFFFDNPKEGTYFWKQFLAGIFMVIATTGLDQDLMQRNLSCGNANSAKKSLIATTLTQFAVIILFLVLGSMMLLYWKMEIGGDLPPKSDDLFGLVAWNPSMPVIVGIMFMLGLVSSAYSAAGSALTALTTSFNVDILGNTTGTRLRKLVHLGMAVCMGLVIIVFNKINSQDAISAVYTLASYTYGPILGLFTFGMIWKRDIRDRWVPAVCIAAPVLSWLVKKGLLATFGYTVGFELILLNAFITFIGLLCLLKRKKRI